MTASHPEHKESLWAVIISPVIWALHFMLSYITAAVWCAKFAPAAETLGPVPWLIIAYTAVGLIGIGLNGVSGWRRHRLDSAEPPHDADFPASRTRFLGYATFLLAVLSGVATLFSSFVVLFFRTCH